MGQERLGSSGRNELATGESIQNRNPENASQSANDGASSRRHENAGREETPMVDDHIAELERRCQTLQRKLNTRPIVYQAPAEDLENPTSAPSTSLASVFKEMVEAPLRSFTRRLLKRDAWLFVFYIHLFFLYMI